MRILLYILTLVTLSVSYGVWRKGMRAVKVLVIG
nr:MAG TPA: hypothetical protein [Caudoviricetes sp.]